ncbi:response regulator [Desertifilum sp. FACHB-1129]|uniref:histidine kinase n=2 Tax=Cyanophyceae TaxID=3028117 RepID=A0A1E5QIU9_9CYAN|nr:MULTISPECIES: response regulator [Cyanophyceae]MCD8486491.1 response regulator [Desertifilum sp.]MDA0210178.1 response regulator [Cyanobacteria bacterium FC1]MDK3155507.1 response regulator [Kamptonema cortianum]MDL5047252.1 response regulator [Oscillatoria amoena NRMC-F 0135]MBD2313596.1 response regulator [Desertifilum sp. FACHB-1129]
MIDSAKLKILVIEDEELVRENLLEILEVNKFEAIAAINGQEGLQKAQENLPDLIICDIMMPDLDGYTVLTELQKDPLTEMIPFIFLTAKTERDDQRLAMELGADDYITKPCTVTELLSAIAIRLKKHAAYTQHHQQAHSKARGLQQRVRELQQISHSQEDLLHKISQELRDPLSNITMAIQMLKLAPTPQARQRYLTILQQECDREIAIINQLSNLQDFLNPENLKLLQRLNSTPPQ